MNHWIILSIVGGALLGLAAVTFLALSGRVLGVSGVLFGLLPPRTKDMSWRLAFVLGLVAAGGLAKALIPGVDAFTMPGSAHVLLAAGLLVGFGARVGSGCTSGHGICGVGRLSTRSMVATLCFIFSGAATVFVVRHLIGA